MTKKITSLIIAANFISAIALAQSFSALYTFDSVKTNSGLIDLSPLPLVSGVVLDSFSATGAAFVNPNATSRFSFTDWSNGATNGDNTYTSLTGSIDLTQYYEVTLAPDNGYTFDLSSITFSVQRSGTGVRTYAVRSSIDAYATNLPAAIAPANTNLSVQTGDVFFWNFDALSNNQNGSTITLDPQNYTGLVTPVTFRFYAWNAEGSSGTFSMDNVTIAGTANSTTLAYFTANNVCENDSIQFTDMSSSLSNIVGWSWNFGGTSPFVTEQNPVHYFPEGIHPVTLTVTDDSAHTNSYTDTVYVYPNPEASWAALTSGFGPCAGDAVNFTNLSTVTTGTIASYEWTFGDMASGANDTSILPNPSHHYVTAATYSVTQIVTSDMGCKDTATVNNLIIASHPVAAYTFDPTTGTTVSFTDASTGGATAWYWDFDANSTNDNANTQNPFYTYPESGIYTACLIVTGTAGCMDTICQSVNSSGVGINETELQNAVQIYPSPSKDGLFTIDVTNSSLNTPNATVYNVIGKALYSKQLQNNKNIIDLSTLNNGIYFITIISDKNTFTKRVIINK